MQERRPTWCRGACPDLVWENFVLMLFSSSLENSWRSQGRSPCWVGLWWKMPSCLLLRPWMNRRPAPPQHWRSISWKTTQGPTPTSKVKSQATGLFFSQTLKESPAAADAGAGLNYMIDLAREQRAALCATEMLSVFNSHKFFSNLTTFWDVMRVSLVCNTFLRRKSCISTTFLFLNCQQYFFSVLKSCSLT